MHEILDEETPTRSLVLDFMDTPCFIKTYTTYAWPQVYQSFQRDNLPPDNLDLDICMVARNYQLHKVVDHTLIFPCVEEFEWIVKHVNFEESMIKDNHGNNITSFSASNIDMYYNIPNQEITLDEDWLAYFKILPRELLKTKGSFKSKTKKEYPNNLLRTPFQLVVAMLCRMYV